MLFLLVAFTCFLTYEIGVFYYPEETSDIIQKTCWYSLKAYTVCDLVFQRLIFLTDKHVVRNIMPFIIHKTVQMNIALVYDGNVVKNYILSDFHNNDTLPPYDFIVHEVCSDIARDKTRHMVIFNNYISFKEDFKVSKVKFLGIQLYISSKPLSKIDVVFGNHNFYVVNNTIFTQSFLKWYVKSATDIIFNSTDKILIEFIDHNMNCIKLKHDEYLVIGKDDYSIISNDKPLFDEPTLIYEPPTLIDTYLTKHTEDNKITEL